MKLDRDMQMDLMSSVKERTDSHVQKWLQNPEFRDALHRYDSEDAEPPLKMAGAR